MTTGRQYGMTFTELYEKVQQELGQISSVGEIKDQYKRRVNMAYSTMLSDKFDWPFLRKKKTITMLPRYNTGSISIDTSGNVVGVGTVWTEAAHDGFQLKASGTDQLFTFTWASATTGTVSPSPVAAIAAGTGYELFQMIYELDEDYSRLRKHKDGWPWYYSGAKPKTIGHLMDEYDWNERVSLSSNNSTRFCRITDELSVNGIPQIKFSPPPQDGKTAYVPYIKTLPFMKEITDTAKTGSTTTKLITTTDLVGKVSIGQWARVDANFQWVRITAIGADTSVNGMTIEEMDTAPANTNPITISDMPQMPAAFHDCIFLRACAITARSKNDKAMDRWQKDYEQELATLISKYRIQETQKKYQKVWRPKYAEDRSTNARH